MSIGLFYDYGKNTVPSVALLTYQSDSRLCARLREYLHDSKWDTTTYIVEDNTIVQMQADSPNRLPMNQSNVTVGWRGLLVAILSAVYPLLTLNGLLTRGYWRLFYARQRRQDQALYAVLRAIEADVVFTIGLDATLSLFWTGTPPPTLYCIEPTEPVEWIDAHHRKYRDGLEFDIVRRVVGVIASEKTLAEEMQNRLNTPLPMYLTGELQVDIMKITHLLELLENDA